MTDPAGLDGEGRLQALDLEPIEDRLRDLGIERWFYSYNATCLQPHTVAEGHAGKWTAVCSSPWNHEAAKREMEFIAHARQDIPALIAEVERLKVEHTRAVLHYTVKGYTAGENTDAKHWRERAEAAEQALAALSVPAAPPPQAVNLRRLLEEAFEAGHFAWPSPDAPTRTAMREAAVSKILNLAPPPQEQPQENPEPEEWICTSCAQLVLICPGAEVFDCVHCGAGSFNKKPPVSAPPVPQEKP